MPLDGVASPPVRPPAETGSRSQRRDLEISPDFDRVLALALAPLDNVMGPRRRAEALCRARQQIHAAAAALVKAERRHVVQAMTPMQLRREVAQLIESHTQLLDYIDDLERQPVIAAEVRRLRRSGAIPWPL